MNDNTEYVYGVNPAFELLRGGKRRVFRAYVNQSSVKSPRMKKLLTFLERNKVPVELLEKGRLFDMCRSHDHQGVVVETEPYPYVPMEELLDRDRLLLLDNIEDPHNLGAILRTAEVLGYDAVCLPTKGVPGIYPSVVKVSAGATEHLSIARHRNANQYARQAADAGFTLMALDAKGDTPLSAIMEKRIARFLLVIGGEDKSVGQFILNMADYTVRIEQSGRIGSLNASVSAAIALHALQ